MSEPEAGRQRLGHLTWPEVQAAVMRGVPALVPIGTVETQGPHAPLGYDYLVAERLAHAVAAQVDCLVCPTLPFGYSHFARPFPGTISLRPETLRAVLTDLCDSLLLHGLRRLVIINNHTSSDPIIGFVADELRERAGIVLAALSPSKLARDLGGDVLDSAALAHGGEPAASLLLYLFPDDMRMEQAERRPYATAWRGLPVAGPSTVRVGGSTATVYMDFAELAPQGAGGDPTGASADKGRLLFERMTAAAVEFVIRFAQAV